MAWSPKPVADSEDRGTWAESLVCADLQRRGMTLLERNFRMKCGELDLVMRDAERLVFVEVRYRLDHRWGDGLASITRTKRLRLLRAANGYLQARPQLRRLPCRFDVVAVSGPPDAPEIRWVRGAFERS